MKFHKKLIQLALENNSSEIVEILLSNSNEIKPFVFEKCTNLTNFFYGDNSFYECSSLIEISIPSSVTKIGNHAFYSCTSLVEILIPPSVTEIGKSAFENCKSLKIVYLSKSD